MTQATASSTATPTMQMSPKRAQQVVKMAKGIRHNFPELTTISDAQLIYATWRSFKQIDQTNDSDYQTMAKVFFHEFDQHLLHYQLSKAGQETMIRQRFFALLTKLL